MKKYFFIYLFALSALIGCKDNSGLYGLLTDYDSRVAALEQMCIEMNTNIIALQTIINVQQTGDYITSITPIMEGGVEVGYTITFANHDPITIYHGKDGTDGKDGKDGKDGTSGTGSDGHTPIIGVAQDTDGVYYWTVDGEWLLDENGNKLRVTGEDGKDGTGTSGENGVTPQLKIEADYWYVSYDNGATWTQLGKAKGDKGDQGDPGDPGSDGTDGDSMFQSVTQDESHVYFTLNDGTVIVINKDVSDFEQIIKDNMVTTLTLTSPKDTIYVGEQVKINAITTPFPDSKKYWSSSDTRIATVEDGVVIGVALGIITITATSGDKTANYTIYVKNTEEPYFSASDTKKIQFACGNLHYNIPNNRWSFAANQYTFLNKTYTNYELTGTKNIDQFEWGASGYNGTAPADKAAAPTSISDLNGTNYDWGKYCEISGYPKGTWRTIKKSEMEYIISTRANAASKYFPATVESVIGVVFLPDNWEKPLQVTTNFKTSATAFSANTISASQFTIMQLGGACFLPGNSNNNIKYWTSTLSSGGSAYEIDITNGTSINLRLDSNGNRLSGHNVRLVRDVE